MKELKEATCKSCKKPFTLFEFLEIQDICFACVMEQDNEDENEYISVVKEKLQLKFNLNTTEVNKIVNDSIFIKLMESDPEYVVNHETDYWVEKIERGVKK